MVSQVAIAGFLLGTVLAEPAPVPHAPSWPTEVTHRAAIAGAGKATPAQRPTAAQRREAVHALATYPAVLAAPHVVAVLTSDPAAEVRMAAVDACARWQAATCIEPLTRAARHDPASHVRLGALGALAAYAPEAAIPVLLDTLKSPSADARAEAARILGEIAPFHPLDGTVGATLLRHLTDADAGVRAAAVTALGRIGDPALAPVVRSLLSDPSPDVQWAAVSSLSRIGGPKAVEPLVSRLRTPADRSVVWEILVSLARIPGREAEDALRAAIDAPPPSFGTIQVLPAAALRPDPSARFAEAIARRIANRAAWSSAVVDTAVDVLLAFGPRGVEAARRTLAAGVRASRRTALASVLSGQRTLERARPAGPDAWETLPTPVRPDASLLAGSLRDRLGAALVQTEPAAGDALRAVRNPAGTLDLVGAIVAAGTAMRPARRGDLVPERLGALARRTDVPPGIRCLALWAATANALARHERRRRRQARAARLRVETLLADPDPGIRTCAGATLAAWGGGITGLAAAAALDPSPRVRFMVSAAARSRGPLVEGVRETPRGNALARPSMPWTPAPAPPALPNLGTPSAVESRQIGPTVPYVFDRAFAHPAVEEPAPAGWAFVQSPQTPLPRPMPALPLGSTYFVLLPRALTGARVVRHPMPADHTTRR